MVIFRVYVNLPEGKSYDDPLWFLPTTIATQPGDSNISKSNSEIFLGRCADRLHRLHQVGWAGRGHLVCFFLAGNTEHHAKKRSTQKLPKVGDVQVLTHNQIIPTTSSGPAAEGYVLCKPIIDTEWKWNNYAKTQVITPSSKTDKLFWFTVSPKQQGLSQTAILTSARVSLSKPSWLVSYGCGYLVGIYYSPSHSKPSNGCQQRKHYCNQPRFTSLLVPWNSSQFQLPEPISETTPSMDDSSIHPPRPQKLILNTTQHGKP